MTELSKAINDFWVNISNIDKEKVNEEEKWHQFDNANIDELWSKDKKEKEDYKRSLNLKQVINWGELETEFFKLALCLIYGGHIAIKYDNKIYYNVYIDTVEFYFHCEDKPGESVNNIINVKDPIMYHRKERIGIQKEEAGPKELPYLPKMSLYAHNSGYDITFENKDLHYRASALIRAYTVRDGKNAPIYRDKKIDKDNRSTYLYDILNGFPLLNDGKNSITWQEDDLNYNDKLITISPRTNVFVSKNSESYDDKEEFSEGDIKQTDNRFFKKPKSALYYKKDLRPWKFSISDKRDILEKRNATNER